VDIHTILFYNFNVKKYVLVKFLFVFILSLLFLGAKTNSAYAAILQCGGYWVSCQEGCLGYSTVDPTVCKNKGGTWSCCATASGQLSCNQVSFCGVSLSQGSAAGGCGTLNVLQNFCSTISSTPTPTPGGPTPTPGGGGGTCNGSCQTLDATHANCGAWGLNGGSGSCGGGQVCCVSKGTETCKFQVPPGPIVLAVGETYKLNPTGAGTPNKGTVIDRFQYSANIPSPVRITFTPTIKSKSCRWYCYHGNCNDMRYGCFVPASGWGTLITAIRPTQGVVNNGIRVTCHIIDSSVNTVKSTLCSP